MQNKDLATTAVLLDETQVIKKLLPKIKFPAPEQQAIVAQADAFISIIRQNKNFCVSYKEQFVNKPTRCTLYIKNHDKFITEINNNKNNYKTILC